MKRRLMSLMLSAVVGLSAGGMAQAETKIKYAAYHSSSETFITVINEMMDTITERTGGDIVFERYYGGSLLKAQDLYPGMARGAVDMVTSAPQAFNPREFPLSGVVLPFMTDNPLAATRAFEDWVAAHEEVQREYERNGAHLLLGWSLAENVLWTKKKIEVADDLKGMRLRMLLGPGEALSLLGATAVATPYTEAIDLLQRGGVDGITTTFFDQGVRDGLGDVSNYVSSAGRMGVFAIMLTSIRSSIWDKFDDETKSIFNEEAEKATERYFAALNNTVDDAVTKLRDTSKVEVAEIDDAEAQRWRELTEGELNKNYIERAARVKADGEALIASYKDLVSKYEAELDYETGLERYTAATNDQ